MQRFKALRKNVIGIRHGEALHNVVGKIYGEKVYQQFEDTTLTTNGMRQAINANIPAPDIVLVSPLTRTLQTATLMFPNVPMIALECLKEYPQHIEICNRRSSIRIISMLFPHVDFQIVKQICNHGRMIHQLLTTTCQSFTTNCPHVRRIMSLS